MPDSATVERTLDRHLVRFADALRTAGLPVPLVSTLEFGRAVAEVGADRRDGVYWAGRATLVHRPEDIPLYDEVFDQQWLGAIDRGRPATVPSPVTVLFDEPDGGPDEGDPEPRDGDVLSVRFSRAEVLSARDFAGCSDDELAELHDLMARLRFAGERRRCRRMGPTTRSGRLDLRRTVRAALRTGGEALSRRYLEAGERPRRLVLLLDVSGSMEAYARALIRFVHAAIVGRRDVEAFALGTRLTRLTRELSTRDPDAALARAAGAVADWSGGTRLGDGLRLFNDAWGLPGMARGAVVVVLSDGWDRGDPTVMAEQMQRLSRVAHRVVWVNPLKATPGYAPLAQGMAAALPHVDEFLEGHNLDSLEVLARAITAE
ncbi:MAG: VWA domain-containing protein [Actinobacteria bacterium]|nr:VWA domain-containing protein [Actinomycetota bacterium]